MGTRIVFRVDSSSTIGSGHVMRCLTLANELRRRGAIVHFVSCEYPGHFIHKLEDVSYLVYRLSPTQVIDGVSDATATLGALSEQHYDWLVVDHYDLGLCWETMVKPLTRHILVIDDLADREHDCDMLLDQNYFGSATIERYESLLPAHCCSLLGPHFALLHPEYAKISQGMMPRSGGIRRVLIFFGGSDLNNHTKQVLQALLRPALAYLEVDVVVGQNHPDYQSLLVLSQKRSGIKLHQNLPSLADLMADADLFIGAGGATTWERLSLGLPSLVISIAENQQIFTQLLAEEGVQLSLPEVGVVSWQTWYEAICDAMHRPASMRALSFQSRKLVDGLGCQRVARRILVFGHVMVFVRPAVTEDEHLLLRWANNPDVREQSFNHDKITANEHARWLTRKLTGSDCILLIGEDKHGAPIGQVRFDMNRKKGEAIIGISLDPVYRGVGLSGKLLEQALRYLKALDVSCCVIAEVLHANVQSKKLFERAQFRMVSSRRPGSRTYALQIEHMEVV
jgi:UDP-2,4-diacetamido-2,4,6-trideoxy-beta-L-altropyranose hydrolase